MLTTDGYGPAVSSGVTAHAPFVLATLPDVEPVVVVVVVDEGLVAVSAPHPHATAAPAMPINRITASRRASLLLIICVPSCMITSFMLVVDAIDLVKCGGAATPLQHPPGMIH
jgi:hypothetical protein